MTATQRAVTINNYEVIDGRALSNIFTIDINIRFLHYLESIDRLIDRYFTITYGKIIKHTTR